MTLTARLIVALLLPNLAAVAQPWPSSSPRRIEAKWNVYVYMNGLPDLERFALRDIEEMKRAGGSDDVNLFVQIAIPDHPVRRYRIEGHEARLISELGRINPFDFENLADFVIESNQVAEAGRHCVVIWGHGSGLPQIPVASRGAPFNPSPRGFPLRRLSRAAERITRRLGGPVDIWGHDSCLMQRLEVGYDLRNAGRFMVGPESNLDGDGWDYRELMNLLTEDPGLEPFELAQSMARLIFENSRASLAGSGEKSGPVTFETPIVSAVDLSKVDALAQALDRLSIELSHFASDPGRMAALVTAHYAARRYSSGATAASSYVDLADLAAQFTGAGMPPALRRSARGVQRAVEAAVITRYGDDRSRGISIYHQAHSLLPTGYRARGLARDTRWDEYLSLELSANLPPRAPPLAGRESIYESYVDTPIPDDDFQGISDSIEVPFSGAVSSVRLFIDLQHSYLGDLEIRLRSPGGRKVTLFSRTGGNGQGIHGWIDTARLAKPFRDEEAKGEWRLEVADLESSDSGIWVSWKLEISTAMNE